MKKEASIQKLKKDAAKVPQSHFAQFVQSVGRENCFIDTEKKQQVFNWEIFNTFSAIGIKAIRDGKHTSIRLVDRTEAINFGVSVDLEFARTIED